MLFDAGARLAVEIERTLDVVYRQESAQGDAFGRNDVTQFLTLSALDFDIAFGNQSFEMPVDRANCHTELIGKRGLVDVGVALDVLEQSELAISFAGGFHSSKFSH